MPKVNLRDIAEIEMGQSPPGVSVSKHGAVPLLNGPTEFTEHHPAPTQYTVDPRKYARNGDILFCVRGSTAGRMNWADKEYAIGRGLAAIRHKELPELQPFVRSVIEYELPKLLLQATGSTFPNISAKQLGSIPYPEMSISSQRAAANLLGSLYDRIYLYHQMSRTLESTLFAIFQSQLTRQESHVKMTFSIKETNAPISNKLYEDWSVKSLSDLATFKNGLALQKYRPESDDNKPLPVVKIAQLRSGEVNGEEWASSKIPSDYIIEDGNIIFSWSGSLIVTVWTGGRAALNQHLFKVTPNALPDWLIYCWLLEHLDDFRSIAADKATTMGHINRRHLDEAECVIPGGSFLEQMDELVAPIYQSMILQRLMSRKLMVLRHLMMNLLMKGSGTSDGIIA